MQRVCVTGAAGFIGSNLVDRLLAAGHDVVGYDNLSTGLGEFLEPARQSERFRFVRGDVLDLETLTAAMAGCDFVFHLAANADVRFGTQHPRRDLEQNTIATYNVLEAMRSAGARRIAFSSTGSIYGEPDVFPTPETAPFPIQTSLYGASKLAGEGLLAAYAAGFGFQAYIFRFVSILGERYTHGHVFDFFNKLRTDPSRIQVLGNGRQRKSYLYVQDCIDAMLAVTSKAEAPVNVYNLGTKEYVEVNTSLDYICEALGVQPVREYTGGERGWIGDSPFILLDTERVNSLGWEPRLTIRDGILRTLAYLQDNTWLLERRA
ncbi:UDP-glucose 4-epimerase [Luteitalea pratensis]|uniref:UDP-glucose 4-epimerase n=1 Tax=Luteitalea pratensis TaxID=1855912 RepID=A0A143PSM0_LUTPR|nr:NAD-dependent epimerase/dehydratase family protein [Luteitalea pratensis]AMY11727.1 UDP-glucose 4-epimerase [Luteitalea pratensis]